MCRSIDLRVFFTFISPWFYSLVVSSVTIVACREDGRILQGEIEINLSISSRLTERESERMGEKEEEEDGGKKFISF